MSQPHELTFAEFAEAVKPSAGMNRWPQLGASADVTSYSVYLNGPVAQQLSQNLQEQEIRDVALHALTEKLGLNPHSMRDNLKVAEIVALRHSYMSMLLDASMVHKLTETVQHEYMAVADQLNHPYVRDQIAQQQALSAKLAPVLADASKTLGAPAQEKAASGVSRGAVISQNTEFTVQAIGDGRVVAHENNRLVKVPQLGENIAVAYYKGKGQVFEDGQDMTFSDPAIDPKTGDLAVTMLNARGVVKQVVLFNNIAAIAQFAEEFELGSEFVSKAVDVRNRTPKKMPERAARIALGEPYLDPATESLALDYKEGAVKFTAIFQNAAALTQYLDRFAMDRALSERATLIEVLARKPDANLVKRSLQEAKGIAASKQGTVNEVNPESGRYTGPVIGSTALHVIQDLGRNSFVIHDKRDLDRVPLAGERMSVAYTRGRAEVAIRDVSKSRDSGVSR
jgi:hypothetical protein